MVFTSVPGKELQLEVAVEAASSVGTMSTLSYTSTAGVRPGLVERTVTLAVITIVGFIGNLVLLVTILQSASLRTVYFNRHIINMAIINLLTCILGLPMVIGYTVTTDWDYGDTMCQIVAHFILTTSIATCLNIFVLNIDRVFAVSNPERYAHRMNLWKTSLMIVIVWLAAILFPLPLTLGIVPTTAFENRYICSIRTGSDINYLLSLYSVCFALPSVVNILFFVYIAREALSEKEAESEDKSRSVPSAYRLWPEVQSAGVVFILYLFWAISELPYITLSSIEQYIHSKQVGGQFEYSADLDTAFMWLKFCDCSLLPFVIFKWRKDIWLKFKDLMFCRKKNSILDSSPRMKERNKNAKNKSKSVPSAAKVDTPKFVASFPIPTLTATRDGLHVQGNPEEEDDADGLEVFYADMDLTTKTDFDGIHSTTAVIERFTEPGNAEETSDYETDPYSQSDPISVRSAGTGQPNRSVDHRPKANSLSHDSGNNSESSSVKKKRRKHRAVADLNIEDTPPISDRVVSPSPSRATSRSDRLDESGITANRQEVTDDIALAHNDNIEYLNEPKAKSQKRKKKKKRQIVSDAETNTSQVLNMEMIERKIPPPRLEPIKSELFQNSVATPPLRSKLPKEPSTNSILPPSGASGGKSRKSKSNDEINVTEDEAPSERARKKKVRPKTKSGDLDKKLMSSDVSSDVNTAAVDQNILESQI